MSKVKVTLVKSTIGSTDAQKANVIALGLHKVGTEKVHNDTPAIRGMITKVNHLLKVEEVKE